jgi:tRNA(Ile)-lysidine synthase
MSVVIDAFEQMVPKDRPILIACSGGIDSRVLLHVCSLLQRNADVLHVNYQLRGAESDADEAFVRSLCNAYGLTQQMIQADPELINRKGKNLQNEARKIRYQAMEEWIEEHPTGIVLLGHHADDQLETFFTQLARGSGSYGLAGMHQIRDPFIRPFLHLRKAELLAFAESNKLEWREDSSNRTDNYLRNRIRNHLLPFLESQNPDLTASILFFQEKLRENHVELGKRILPALELWQLEQAIDLNEWIQWDQAERLTFLREIGAPTHLLNRANTFEHLQSGAQIDFGFTTLQRVKNTLRPIQTVSASSAWDFKSTAVNSLPTEFDLNSIYVDQEKIVGRLVVRPVKSDDTLSPPGLNGKQRIHKILKDIGVPVGDRKLIYVLSDDFGALWLPGIKVDKRCLATKDSERILKLEKK